MKYVFVFKFHFFFVVLKINKIKKKKKKMENKFNTSVGKSEKMGNMSKCCYV